MTINEKQDELIDEFSMFDEWMDKYENIIDYGKDLKGLDDSEKNDENIVRGCQSNVWLTAKLEDDKLIFNADSDAIITKGIIGLLIRVFDNESPKAVATADLRFISEIGLHEHLSPTRSNGLASMIKKMKLSALKAV